MSILICPRCGNMWCSNTKSKYPQCSTCKTSFKPTPSRKISSADRLWREMYG